MSACEKITGLQNRIFANSIPVTETGCWLWLLAVDKDGYGLITIDGKSKRVHRLSYEIFKGDIPEKMLVLHSCDMPSCVNPEHLKIGTHKDNYNDMESRGRHPHDPSHHSKLNELQVRAIHASNEPLKSIARKFNITIRQVIKIRKCERWKKLGLIPRSDRRK